MHFYFNLVLIGFISLTTKYDCAVPKNGYGWGYDDLIQKSEHIVLARVKSQVIHENPSGVYTKLEVIENVKGTWNGEIEFFSLSNKYFGFDFSFHTEESFWEKSQGRSDFPCCICGPDHTFVSNDTYLLFPSSFGAEKSAEIIRDTKKDKWYLYVLSQVN